MHSKIKIIVLVLFLFVALVGGCKQDDINTVVGKGQLKVGVLLPKSSRSAQAQATTKSMTPTGVTVTVSMGAENHMAYGEVIGGKAEVAFDNLKAGDWHISVIVADDDNVDIASGTGDSTIIPGVVSEAQVKLAYLPGDLDISVAIPEGLGITRGSVVLTSLTGSSITKPLDISGLTGKANITGLVATAWPLKIALYNSRDVEVAWGEGMIDILAGRLNTAVIKLDTLSNGSLIITPTWDMPPAPPTGVSAEAAGASVNLSWRPSYDSDVVGYGVYRSTSFGGSKKLITPTLVKGTSFTDTAPEYGTINYYWVVAYDGAGLVSRVSEATSVSPSLKVIISGKGSVTKVPDQTVYSFGTAVILTAVPDPAWRFVRWEGSLSGSQSVTEITMDGNKEVTAVFAKK